MVAFDRESTRSRLASLRRPALVAFMASCVQRRACCVRVLADHGRNADLAVFNDMLENLWRAASSSGPGDVQWDVLDHFEEIRSDEEGEGLFAFSEDAIVSLWYATQYVRNGNVDFAFHCANRCYDSAGFVDEVTDSDSSFADVEAQMQLDDLAVLEGRDTVPDDVLSDMRTRSTNEAERVFSAIRRML